MKSWITLMTVLVLITFLGCKEEPDSLDNKKDQYTYESMLIYQHVSSRKCDYLVIASNRVGYVEPDGKEYDIVGELVDYNATTTKYCVDYGRSNNAHGCVEYDYGSSSYGSCTIGINRTLR